MREVKLLRILEKADVGVFKINKKFGDFYIDGSEIFNNIVGIEADEIHLDRFIAQIVENRHKIKSEILSSFENALEFDLDIKIENNGWKIFGTPYSDENGFCIIGGIKKNENRESDSEYLISMFHEIRTPINAILSTIHLLNKTKLDKIQRNYLDKTKLSAKTLLMIANNILDFSKIQSGKIKIENTKFSLHYLLDEIDTLFHSQILQKNLQFKIIIDRSIEKNLIGDSLKLKQILLNLVSNSIKFTKEGYIKIEIIKQKQAENKIKLLFNVEDTGIGLSLEETNKLFEPFSQANSLINLKYGGTGLGLAISKKLAEIIGGEIWCDSLSGQGTVFRFTADFFIDTSKNDPDYNAYVLPQNLKNKKILLVEDDEINKTLTKEILSAEGFYVDLAENGLEAVFLSKNKNYDIILMDLHMPEMDGIAAANKIREFSSLPIIALTANSLEEDKFECLSAGMNDFLNKPIDPFELYKCIERWLINEPD